MNRSLYLRAHWSHFKNMSAGVAMALLLHGTSGMAQQQEDDKSSDSNRTHRLFEVPDDLVPVLVERLQLDQPAEEKKQLETAIELKRRTLTLRKVQQLELLKELNQEKSEAEDSARKLKSSMLGVLSVRTVPGASDKSGDKESPSVSVPFSSKMSEQLLTEALSELQKVTWDLETERALLKAVRETKEAIAKQLEAKVMLQDAMLQRATIQRDSARQSVDLAEQLRANGSLSAREFKKLQDDLQIADADLKIAAIRREIEISQSRVQISQQEADIGSRVTQLEARKSAIEATVSRLHDSQPKVLQSEEMKHQAERLQSLSNELNEKGQEVKLQLRRIESLHNLLEPIKTDRK